jgi:hypothetical protein
MWQTWRLSQSIRCRPSELADIRHGVVAFYFDRVVASIGQTIEAEIEVAQEKSKNRQGAAVKAQLVLNRWLRAEGGAKYRDPAAR